LKSCGFVCNDGLAKKDCILLHVSEIWAEVCDEIRKPDRKSAVSSGTDYFVCLFVCLFAQLVCPTYYVFSKATKKSSYASVPHASMVPPATTFTTPASITFPGATSTNALAAQVVAALSPPASAVSCSTSTGPPLAAILDGATTIASPASITSPGTNALPNSNEAELEVSCPVIQSSDTNAASIVLENTSSPPSYSIGDSSSEESDDSLAKMKKEFDAALKKENESKEMCENQYSAADEASSGNRLTLPRLC
jgi:hypothetical protein